MGPERYRCGCGQIYLTGATEWDHLSAREQKRRIVDTIVLGLLFSAMLSVPALVFCLVTWLIFHRLGIVLIAALFITVLPFFKWVIPFLLEVILSIWRTRRGGTISS
jgi:hypothetical protein